MADPIIAHLGTDRGAELLVSLNENFRRRHAYDVRSVLDAAATQVSSDEMLIVSATSAPRTLTLLAATTNQSLRVWITAADGANTYTVNGVAYTTAKKLELVADGSAWSTWDLS